MSYYSHHMDDNLQMTIDRGFDPNDSYGPVDGRCFIKIVDDDTSVCILCDKKLKLVSQNTIEMHCKTPVHLDNYQMLVDKLLNQQPGRDTLQMTSSKEYLNRLYQQHALQENLYEVRDLIINQFIVLWQSVDNLSTFRVQGSHLTRTALTHSNINLEIIHPNSKLFKKDPRAKNSVHNKLIDPHAEIGKQFNFHTTEYDLISNPIEILYKIYANFTHYYSAFFQVYSEQPCKDIISKVPKLTLRHVETGTILDLSCYDDISYKQSELLKIYTSLDDRVRELACLVRYWANVCGIDKPDRGTYPPETYLIMIIYYLQRTSPPILPCIHEMFSNLCLSSEKNAKNRDNKSDDQLDQLSNGINNLKLENESWGSADRNNSNGVDDHPGIEADQLSASATTTGLEEQDSEPVDDEPEEEDEDDEKFYFHCNLHEINELIRNWVPREPDLTVHDLFIAFMKYMKDDLDVVNSSISIRQSARQVHNSAKNTLFRTKMIENPINPSMNISRCIGTQRQFNYIVNCFRRAYHYLTSIPLNDELRIDDKPKRYSQDFIRLYYNEQRLDSYVFMKWFSDGKLIERSQKSKPNVNEMLKQQLFARDVYVINALFDKVNNQQTSINDLPKSIANAYNKRFLIPLETESTKFCWLCKNLGHVRGECFNIKMLTLHEEIRTYDTNLDSDADFDEMFWEIYQAETITPGVSETHDKTTQIILGIIQTGLPHYDFELRRFGSTVNNLGSIGSDIDICLTLRGRETGVGLDCVKILEEVYKVLAAPKTNIHNLEPVLKARVPIIRFKFRNFDIDLSMYNHCALYNSELLRFYSTIDERVPLLAFLVKKIAKVCCIADASRGSLSSYGWSLLVIHYLQHIDPPILPCLQEALTSDETTTSSKEGKEGDNKFGVQGWNVWFRKDLGNFQRSSNLTVTELFKGFFLYYGCFDWDTYIVSIRKSSYIARYQKSWNNSVMAIEDPFELTYNLANRLDDEMAIYIINTLANAYRHIIKTQYNYRETKARNSRFDLHAVLFSSIRSINGSDPPWRGCRLCHRIGHRVKDCPDRNARKPIFYNNKRNNNPIKTNGDHKSQSATRMTNNTKKSDHLSHNKSPEATKFR